MEFSVSGEESSGLNRVTLSYQQSMLAVFLGFEFKIGESLVIAPQIIKSYMGSSRLQYASYTTDTGYIDYPYEYVTDTDIIGGRAELSGWELPIYWVGQYFYVGLKFSAYNNKTEIMFSNGYVGEVSITGALSMVLEAKF